MARILPGRYTIYRMDHHTRPQNFFGPVLRDSDDQLFDSVSRSIRAPFLHSTTTSRSEPYVQCAYYLRISAGRRTFGPKLALKCFFGLALNLKSAHRRRFSFLSSSLPHPTAWPEQWCINPSKTPRSSQSLKYSMRLGYIACVC
jgi:hypothetical protein